MLMTRLFFASVLVGAVPVLAAPGSINLELRTDLRSQDYSDDASKKASPPGGYDNYKFYLQTGRIDFKGSLSEEFAYRLRFRFAGKDQGSVSQRDSTNDTLDFAYIAHKLNSNLTLTAGKFSSEIGGYEGNTSGSDLYFNSEAYGGTKYLAGSAGINGYSGQLYYTGVKLAAVLGDHELNLQSANSSADRRAQDGSSSTTANNFDQDSGWTGVVLKLNFLEKALGFIGSYHWTRPTDDNSKLSYKAAGLQWKKDALHAQLDWHLNEDVSSQVNKSSIESWILNLRYNLDQWTPFAKFVSSIQSSETGAAAIPTNRFTSYGVGTEFKAKKDDLYRYHVAIQQRNMRPDSGADRALLESIVGMKIYADFLK